MENDKTSQTHRLNLGFGDKIALFIEKKSKERELSKQAYIRQLIIDKMESEKE